MTNGTVLIAQRAAVAQRGRRLEFFTIAWNSLEGLVAVVAGAFAGSVSLVGFGIDHARVCRSHYSTFTLLCHHKQTHAHDIQQNHDECPARQRHISDCLRWRFAPHPENRDRPRFQPADEVKLASLFLAGQLSCPAKPFLLDSHQQRPPSL